MKLTAIALLLACTLVSAGVYSQTVTLSLKNAPLEKVFKEIRKQTGYEFLYNTEMLEKSGRITIEIKNQPLTQALDACFKTLPLSYSITDRIIIVKPRKEQGKPDGAPDPAPVTIKGRVLDENSSPLAGASVLVKGTEKGGTSGKTGEFSLQYVGNYPVVIVVSFIGYQRKELTVNDASDLSIALAPGAVSMKDVVISTGVYTRRQESFTGAAATFTGEQLKTISNQNVLQSLKVLDPSFAQLENNLAGSDPNQLPDIQMRGASSLPDLKGNYTSNPNLPLFVLDGFETSLQKVFDLDMNRVASITLLKDAAAKAIYGSRAANGVVVIETKRPAAGRMRITYNADVTVTAPDLSSYDLANAAEKLQVEVNAGRYQSTYQPNTQLLQEQYNETYKEVARGVNTYWLSKPLRVGIGQKHGVFLEGGDHAIRYGVDLSYNNIAGVMKGSDRNTISGTVNLSYRTRKIIFRNLLTVAFNKADDSPYGAFSDYARLNAYWTPYDSSGKLKRFLGQFTPIGSLNVATQYANPLYNASIGTKNFSKYTEITNNFYAEYQMISSLKLTGRFGFTSKQDSREDFYPANHTRYNDWDATNYYKRGEYTITEGLNKSIKTDITLNYSKQAGRHQLLANAGANIYETVYTVHGMKAQGFLNNRVDYISFAKQYAENGRPTGSETTTHEIGLLAAVNYSFDNRFLADVSIRRTGSSVFGANNRWGNFWSAGLGWNIHNEEILKKSKIVNVLKLRGSVGYTGNQNFNPYQAMATYNYYTDVYYDNVVSAKLLALANDDLKWQQTRDINVGVDAMLMDRLSMRFDYYTSTSDNLLIDLSLPGTTGFTSFKQNVGSLQNKGIDATLSYKVYNNTRKEAFVSVFVSAAHNENKIVHLSNALDSYNDEQDKSQSTKPLVRYKEGQSTTVIWAVPSLGIDPVTGSEVFRSKDGSTTYVWNANDQVVAGESAPKLNGSFGLNAQYKGFGFNCAFSYRIGGQYYNQTLVDKVENVDIQYNVDRRVFTNTWKNPGDVVYFKKINAIPSTTYASTRFIEDLNELEMTSVNVSYDFRNHAFIKRSVLEGLRVTFYMMDVFRTATVKTERGLNFPYARTFSFSVKANF